MLRIITTLIVMLIGFIGTSQSPVQSDTGQPKYNVIIKVPDIENQNGKVLFAIYDSEANFSQRKPVALKSAKIVNGTAEVVFDNLKPHVYAVTCFHDANSNGIMDFSGSGMPEEDYGATNNVVNYGPPRFEDAKFELKDKDLTFEIKFM